MYGSLKVFLAGMWKGSNWQSGKRSNRQGKERCRMAVLSRRGTFRSCGKRLGMSVVLSLRGIGNRKTWQLGNGKLRAV